MVPGCGKLGENGNERASVQNPATFVCLVRVERPTECGIRTLFLAGGIDFGRGVGYAKPTFAVRFAKPYLGEIIMQWTAPAFEEVCLNCEINSYASAKL